MNDKKEPIVTLITPTFNQAAYLPESIDSILAQTYKNIEYLVVNDGSTDSTEAILKSYEGRIKWTSQTNRGQPETLNAAWRMAQGKYIGYLSSDDVLLPKAVEQMVAHLESHPECVCVYPDCHLIDQYSRIIKRNVCRGFDRHEMIVLQECTIGAGALFRKDSFDRLGGWDTSLKLAPDREFWIRISSDKDIFMVNEVLAHYRLHNKSLSYSHCAPLESQEYLRVLDKVFTACTDAELLARKSEAYGHAYYLMARNALRSRAYKSAISLFSKARLLHPPLGHPRFWLSLIKTSLSKPVRTAWASLRQPRK